MLFLLLFFATKAHFKTSLRVSSEYLTWVDLPKGKLIQNVYKAKFQTDSCFELDRKTHYCGVADEMAVLNTVEFAHFTVGDVVLASEISSVDEVKQVLDGMNESQRAYIHHEAQRQGYDLEQQLFVFDEEYLALTFEFVCHGKFSGRLFQRIDEDMEILIKAGQNSPFCTKQEKLPTGAECQTGYDVSLIYATEFQIPFGFAVVCENPLNTCIRTDGNQDSGRGICARETDGVGCGNACPEDEYCAMTNGFDVARADYFPKTASEIAWPGISFTNVVTVICPFAGNFERFTNYAWLHSPPYRKYDTPFCTCKKRLAEGSQCQYTFDRAGKHSLNLVSVSRGSPNALHLQQKIDVGCAENLVCKKQPKDLGLNLYQQYGTCAKRNQN